MNDKNFDALIEEVLKVEIPDNLQKIIEKYKKVGGKRDEFLWKWIWRLSVSRNPGFMFSSVPKDNTIDVGKLKFLLCVLDVLIDDIADKYQDENLLDIALKIPSKNRFENFQVIDRSYNKRYLYLIVEVWNKILEEASKSPRWKDFKDMFMFDIKQTLNSFYYSLLINKNINLINLTESKIYTSHNMIFFLFADVDMLFSPELDKDELPYIREVVWRAQQMARIGNWVSTWEREINDNDFSSGIFSFSLTNNIIKLNELEQCKYTRDIKDLIVNKIKESKVEEYFLNEWKAYYKSIKDMAPKIKSVDVNAYLDGLVLLLNYHLASRGKK